MMSATQRGSQIAALRFWFALDRGAALVLVELVQSAPTPLTRAELAQRCDMSMVGVRVRISELRTAMETEAIDTTSHGYVLTPIGLEECRQAFEAMAADLTMEKAA